MSWTEHTKLRPLRERSAAADFVLDTLAAYSRHRTGRNASLLAYMGILTVFPLLLAATTVLGIVLEGNPKLQQQIIDSAFSKIPVIGAEIQANQGQLPSNWWAFAVGLAGAIWGSLRAFVAMQTALDDIWEIETGRDNFLFQRLRALIGIGVIFLSQLGSVVLASLVSHAGLPRTGQFLLTVGGLALNIAVVAAMYRYLTSRDTTWRMVWPGAVFTGIVFTALQLLGTNIVARQSANADEIYGTFGAIITLAAWISLHGLIALVGAEINATIERRRRRGRKQPHRSTWAPSGRLASPERVHELFTVLERGRSEPASHCPDGCWCRLRDRRARSGWGAAGAPPPHRLPAPGGRRRRAAGGIRCDRDDLGELAVVGRVLRPVVDRGRGRRRRARPPADARRVDQRPRHGAVLLRRRARDQA